MRTRSLSNTLYSADWHLNHPGQAARRGFHNVVEHDQLLFRNYVTHVRPGDLVIFPGDMIWKDAELMLPMIADLPGRKILVTGNHDEVHGMHAHAAANFTAWAEVFDGIFQLLEKKIDGRRVLVSHFPYAGDHSPQDRHVQHRPRDLGKWIIHGHLHCPEKVTGPRQIHVGVDAWDMRPVAEGEIVGLMRANA